MENVVKTAIAIPKAEYQKIEKLRGQMGKTRSQFLMDTFHVWLKQREEEDLEARYAAGYARHPEKKEDIEPMTRAGLKAWEKEPW